MHIIVLGDVYWLLKVVRLSLSLFMRFMMTDLGTRWELQSRGESKWAPAADEMYSHQWNANHPPPISSFLCSTTEDGMWTEYEEVPKFKFSLSVNVRNSLLPHSLIRRLLCFSFCFGVFSFFLFTGSDICVYLCLSLPLGCIFVHMQQNHRPSLGHRTMKTNILLWLCS